MIYSNARVYHETKDWPSGRHRVSARFWVRCHDRLGCRVERETMHPTRRTWSKPKATTYMKRAAIVDGDDGRIYVIGVTDYGQRVVWSGTLKTCEYVEEAQDPDRWRNIGAELDLLEANREARLRAIRSEAEADDEMAMIEREEAE